VVHHATKEGRSSRGSGALLGAADLIVKVAKGADGAPNTATVEAAKDDADGAVLPFLLRAVDLPPGPDGEARRTCVAENAEGAAARAKPLPPRARDVMRYLADLIAAEGGPLPAGALFPPGLRGVAERRWREECETRRLSMAERPEDRARTYREAARELKAAGQVALRDGWVWLARPERSVARGGGSADQVEAGMRGRDGASADGGGSRPDGGFPPPDRGG
jgi:hypothetical protein